MPRIRRILYMPSLVAKGVENTRFYNLYNRVYDRTGIKMKGIVAVQKKLLTILYHLWKKDVPYIECIKTNNQDNSMLNEKEAIQVMASQGKHLVTKAL